MKGKLEVMFEEIEKNAEKYSREAERFSFFLYSIAIKDLEKLKIKGKWLEAGSGPGILAVKLSKKLGIEVEGIDNSKEMIEIASRRAKKFNAKVRFRVADVHEPIEGSYDVVYSTFSLHHWKNPRIGLKNLWNALNPDGYLYILDVRRNPIIKHGLNFKEFLTLFDEIKNVSKEFEVRKRFPFLVTVKAKK